jgi:PAS fold
MLAAPANNDLDYSSSRYQMDRLLGVAKVLVDADSAAILLTQGGISHCVAETGLASGIVAFPWSWEDAPFKPNQTVVEQNPANLNVARALSAVTGGSNVGMFIRKPLIVSDKYVLALQLYAQRHRTLPTKAELRLLDQLAKSLAKEVKELVETFVARDSLVAIAASYEEMLKSVNATSSWRALLDPDLEIIAISNGLANNLGSTQKELIGASYFAATPPVMETMAHLFKRALETSISSPEFEIISDRTGRRRSYTVRASPFRPEGHGHDLLDIVVLETTGPRDSMSHTLEKVNGFAEVAVPVSDTGGQFLLDTLLAKRSVRFREDMSYLTIRAWRGSVKQHQIKALRAVKKTLPGEFIANMGRECAAEIHRLVGTNTFKFAVPVPCGHSPEGSCLSFALAKAVAVELGIPVIQAFAYLSQIGSSHPKGNLTRQKMKLVREVPGPAILIDDVATSGLHLQECSSLLKARGTETFAVAWIGGDSAE